MSESPIIDLLSRRDVDDLNQTARALHAAIAMAEIARARDHREAMAKLERLTLATEKVAAHTANLPALVELMTARTNGNSHHEEASHAADR